MIDLSRPPARTRGLKPTLKTDFSDFLHVASSREDAWIETPLNLFCVELDGSVASSREYAWIET